MNHTRFSAPLQRAAKTLTLVAAAAALAACASRGGPMPELDQARTSVGQAASNPAVARYAQLEMKAAQDTLQRADQAWNKDGDASETRHLAYLAAQRAEIALQTARARQLDQDAKQATTETDRLRLQARTQEAERARAQAQTQAAAAQAATQRASAAEQRAAQQSAAAQAATAQAQAAQERVRALESKLREIEGQQTERGLLVTLGDVLFAFNEATLSPQAGPRLDKLAQFLRDFPERKLLIEGYTDSVGSESYNLTLSQRRADAVRDALVQRGVQTDRISTRGYGKAHPVADNASPEGRAMNRRVEIVIADESGNLKAR